MKPANTTPRDHHQPLPVCQAWQTFMRQACGAAIALAAVGAHAQQVEPTEYGYDPEGNLTFIKDPLGRITEQTPDNLGRIQTQTLPPTPENNRPQITYSYDGQGRLSSVTDALGHTTTYTYSGLGDLNLLSPDTGASNLLLNELGLPSRKQDARGVEAAIDYDQLNRATRSGAVSSFFNPNGTYSQYVYDDFSTTSGAENYGIGRLTSIREFSANSLAPLSGLNLAYDQQGRITRRCQTYKSPVTNCTPRDTLYQQWGTLNTPDTGRLVSQTYPSGRVVSYQYNALGQIEAITTTGLGGVSQQTVVQGITYAPLDVAAGGYGVTGLTFGNGPQTYARTYDTSGRTLSYTLGKGLVSDPASGLHTLELDDAGAVTAINRLQGSWTATLFDYDEVNRLTAMSYNGGQLFAYSHDSNGNRQTRADFGQTRTYAYEPNSNRLTAAQDASGGQVMNTDAVGNVMEIAGATSTIKFYDDTRTDFTHGRYIISDGALGRYLYSYNGLGQRMRKKGASTISEVYIGSKDTVFHYDMAGHLIAEMDPATKQVKREYIWLGDMPVAAMAGTDPTLPIASSNPAAMYYIHTDQLNTPRLVTDTNKKRRWDWSPLTNEPFGATQPNQKPIAGLPAFAMNLRFPGQYYDSETGTFYNHFRTYHPNWGRYLQSDPIGLAGGLNTYNYVRGQPTRYTDSLGLYTEVVIWNGVGMGSSSMGHVSTNVNGTNYSWGPGGWDSRYPSASNYNNRQQSFRGGTGYALNLTPEEEKAFERCMKARQGSYNVLNNNCASPPQDCLPPRLGLPGDKTFPGALGDDLRNSPGFIGTLPY
jgi:RHS repeat-associated protein